MLVTMDFSYFSSETRESEKIRTTRFKCGKKGTLPPEFSIHENIFRDEGKIKNSPMKEIKESVSHRPSLRITRGSLQRESKFYHEETGNIKSQRKSNRDNKYLSKFNRLLFSHRVL